MVGEAEGGGRILFQGQVCDLWSTAETLVVVYINDLDVNIQGMIYMFVDDLKIGGVVDIKENCPSLHLDINQIENRMKL